MKKKPEVRLKLANLKGEPEIFHTIQGEGKNTGVPSVFIRTSLCNLHCYWCDTDYTWNWEGTRFSHQNDENPSYRKFKMEDWILETGISEVADRVCSFDCRHVVITGGEPMLQQKELAVLMRELLERDPDFFFETETNGTILPDPVYSELCHQFNVSPKLSNSRNKKSLRLKADVLSHFVKTEKANFKFVISAESDLEEVLEIQEKYHIPAWKIWLMPEGVNKKSLNLRAGLVAEICKSRGFHFSDRLHIRLYGPKRGV